jgi:DNA-binding NtrC family response regulator
MLSWKRRRIADLPKPSMEDVRKRVRILVIDDDENSFPLALLRNEGYAIDHWPKVQSLKPLEEGFYDIIVLDIGGVAKEFSAEDGLGILEHIKERNPSQVVVAFSGLSFDLGKKKFWQLTDDMLAKPADATKCKRVLDNLIEHRLSPQAYWSAIEVILKKAGVADNARRDLEDKLVQALGHKDREQVASVIRNIVKTSDTAITAINVAIKLCALLGF